MLSRLLQRWRKQPVTSAGELARFLDRNAWLIAQKSVIGYCTVKTHLPIQELLKDKPFADAYEVSIRESYAAVLAGLIVVAEGYLRTHANGRGSIVAARLVETYDALLGAHPLPSHRPQGWEDDVAALRCRLDDALAAAPKLIREVASVSAQRVIATLPIHQRLREPDGPAVEANVQFLMVGLAHEFESRLDGAAIVADMAAQP